MSPKEGIDIDLAIAGERDSWQSECGDLRARLTTLKARGLWTDCELAVGAGAERLPAHRVLLASASPVLAAMLYGRLPVPRDQPLQLPDVEPDTARTLLEYIYTDNISISSCDVACCLFRVAHYLLMPHLETICRTYLLSSITSECAVRIFEFAELFDEKELLEKCLKKMESNATEVLATVGVAEVPRVDTLTQLFALPELNIRSELELLRAAERWVKQQTAADAANLIRPALQQIRFLTMAPAEFAQTNMNGLLSQQDVLAISLNLLSNESHLPMPQGFSVSKELRCHNIQNKGVLRAVINISEEIDIITNPINLQGLSWSLKVSIADDGDDYDEDVDDFYKNLDIYLVCHDKKNISRDCYWTCDATVLTRFPYRKQEGFNHSQIVYCKFGRVDTSCQLVPDLTWEELTHPTKGYVQDNKITLEVEIDAMSPVID